MKRNNFDITVIGAGRVGLPLALSFESRGLSVAIKDINLKTGSASFHPQKKGTQFGGVSEAADLTGM
jgi:2-polyprenyl-6-methoxyphenol hydroxylase-like FAD-dependent oxidoreductase